ncbi:hypothetical protein BsWGS_16353 [Bradybaena similaris]
MSSPNNEEFDDSNFEWSFLELTAKMQQLLKDDRQNITKALSAKRHTFSRPETSFQRRLSMASEVTSANVLDSLPKTVSAIYKRTGEMKEDLDRWSFDIFALSSSTSGHPMQALAFDIFTIHDLLNVFQLTEEHFMKFIVHVERHYRSNPYHNACHAADVLQTLNCMVCKTGFLNTMNHLELFCLFLTAIIHDIEHTGTNNSFHKNSGSDFAKLYVVNVLENHHLRVGLKAIQEFEILRSLDPGKYDEFQYMLVTMILATDMANHFMLITNMKLMLSMPTKCKNRIRIKRILLLLLHCADISNPAKPWDLHKIWVSLLIEEFFLQGDKEKEMKLPITPNCDRNTANIATLQIGFMQTFSKDTFIVTDQLMEQELVQGGFTYIRYQPWHDCMEENMTKWSGKWKFLKYDQINELMAETVKPRLSMASPPRKGSYNKVMDQTICFCCRRGRKRYSSEEDTACAAC